MNIAAMIFMIVSMSAITFATCYFFIKALRSKPISGIDDESDNDTND